MGDALILAKRSGHDVFNSLDLLQNQEFMKVCYSFQAIRFDTT